VPATTAGQLRARTRGRARAGVAARHGGRSTGLLTEEGRARRRTVGSATIRPRAADCGRPADRACECDTTQARSGGRGGHHRGEERRAADGGGAGAALMIRVYTSICREPPTEVPVNEV
jgi:hypothetical protein